MEAIIVNIETSELANTAMDVQVLLLRKLDDDINELLESPLLVRAESWGHPPIKGGYMMMSVSARGLNLRISCPRSPFTPAWAAM